MKNKKATLAINIIIFFVISLAVLIISIVFFKTQMTKGAEKYERISEGLDKCEGFLKGRKCMSTCPPGKEVRSISGEWADCGKEKGKENKPYCCEV